MGVPPLWARLVGYAIAAGFLAALGLKWGLIIGGVLTVFYFFWHRRTFGHWP